MRGFEWLLWSDRAAAVRVQARCRMQSDALSRCTATAVTLLLAVLLSEVAMAADERAKT